MDVNYRLKVVGFFLTISEWDRHLEVIRQILNALEAFEPYAAYLRLSKGRGTPITATEINDFMRSNGFEGDYMAVSLIVRLYDTRFEGSLDFEDFLKMVLSRDNPEIRYAAAQRENYEVESGDLLAPEVEYTLARFFFKASQFLSKMMSDPETHLILNQTNLFKNIDKSSSRCMDFNNLKAYFEESKIRPRDAEIISILRIIDVNDDGKINENEFNYFIELFSGKEPSSIVLNSLKAAHLKENQYNYFGERMNQDAFKYAREREAAGRYSPSKGGNDANGSFSGSRSKYTTGGYKGVSGSGSYGRADRDREAPASISRKYEESRVTKNSGGSGSGGGRTYTDRSKHSSSIRRGNI